MYLMAFKYILERGRMTPSEYCKYLVWGDSKFPSIIIKHLKLILQDIQIYFTIVDALYC